MKVSDADRRIAEEALGYDYAIMPTEAEQREIVELAEYFARHRHEAIEMAAKVADHLGGVRDRSLENRDFRAQHVRAKTIATAIRALAGEGE